jgi:hypothetical protein
MKLRYLGLITLLIVISHPVFSGGNPEAGRVSKDDTWISVSGTAESVDSREFQLDYGDGQITVDMSGWDKNTNGYLINDGIEVTVTGIVDDDFLEKTTINAVRLYNEEINTYFYTYPTDAEDEEYIDDLSTPKVVSDMTIQGTVTEIIGSQFKIKGPVDLTVDTTTMPYDPLANERYQAIETGDRVSVTGTFVRNFFDSKRIIAESIITISTQ